MGRVFRAFQKTRALFGQVDRDAIVKHPAQDDTGLKGLLTISRVYDFVQNLLGGAKARRWIARNIWKVSGGEKVVDIGCGPGSSLKYLPDEIEYLGFDVSEDYIEAARESFPGRGTFLVGTALDFLDETRLADADLVLCNGLLHHLPDDEVMAVFESSKRISAIERSFGLCRTSLSYSSNAAFAMDDKQRSWQVLTLRARMEESGQQGF